MKRIFLTLITLIITALFLSCESPTITTAIIEDQPTEITEEQGLTGQWIRRDEVITFYDNGNFTFHDYYTLDIYYYGFYIDYGDSIYLEVYDDGMNQFYWYEIVKEYGDYILKWRSEGMSGTANYVLIK